MNTRARIVAVVVLFSSTPLAAPAQTPAGGDFLVNTYTTGRQWFPRVAADAAGGFVVVWSSYGQDGSGDGVFGQAFDAAGVRRGSEFRVNTYTTGDQSVGFASDLERTSEN